jgi:hypothetical protein
MSEQDSFRDPSGYELATDHSKWAQTYFLKRKAMQETSGFDVWRVNHVVLVPTAAGNLDDIALEGEWKEVDEGKKVYQGGDQSHHFRAFECTVSMETHDSFA